MSVAALASEKEISNQNLLHQADALTLFLRRIYAPDARVCA